MTVTTIESDITYTGNGAQTNFPFGFRVIDAADITVYLDGLELLVGVVVNVNPDQEANPGGSVDIGPAPGAGVEVYIARETPPTQQVDYRPFDPFPAETHELALDRLTLLVQENTTLADQKLEFLLAPPAAATDPGVAGQVAFDADWLYVCVAANTWKRAALVTW